MKKRKKKSHVWQLALTVKLIQSKIIWKRILMRNYLDQGGLWTCLQWIVLTVKWCRKMQSIVTSLFPRLGMANHRRVKRVTKQAAQAHLFLSVLYCEFCVTCYLSFYLDTRNDGLRPRIVSQINPFSLGCFWLWIFYHSQRNELKRQCLQKERRNNGKDKIVNLFDVL